MQLLFKWVNGYDQNILYKLQRFGHLAIECMHVEQNIYLQ